MNKNVMIVLAFVLGIGAILFADEVIAIFAGMSALEALRSIWTFFLHVAVTTVLGYVVFGLPEIVKPWVRMLKRSARAKKRAMRRGEVVLKAVSRPRNTRINKDALIAWLASQNLKRVKTEPVENPLKFKI